MKGLTVAVLGLCVASASARIVVLQAKAVFHTDQWCSDHHLGEGPSTCIQHSGCCYDGRIGICHSCDAHSDEWCGTYGGTEVKSCVGYAGCTFTYDDAGVGTCVTAKDPADFEALVITCEESMAKAMEAAKTADTDIPNCTAEGEWAEIQIDESSSNQSTWCADEGGHEIPDTRMGAPAFKTALTNCSKERRKHGGEQCPNSVTLATGNGEVMINDHPDVGNCDITCNTDKDCKGTEWCCYNGCGYSCQVPIFPKADCATLILGTGEAAADYEVIPNQHGTQVDITCATGFFGSDPVSIECKHGSWDDYEMTCLKDCETYRIVGGRDRDYDISGKGMHHDETRKISCIRGYGAVAGSPDAMRFYKETITCVNGEWSERSLECSSCFDAGSEGPQAWWTGITDGTLRNESFDCQYFESRPLACADWPEAQSNCRISCRTCDAMLMKYKVKAVRDNVQGTKHQSKWLPKKLRFLVAFQNYVTEDRRTKVATRVKKVQAPEIAAV